MSKLLELACYQNLLLVQRQQPNIAIASQVITSAASAAWGMPHRIINEKVSVLQAGFG